MNILIIIFFYRKKGIFLFLKWNIHFFFFPHKISATANAIAKKKLQSLDDNNNTHTESQWWLRYANRNYIADKTYECSAHFH